MTVTVYTLPACVGCQATKRHLRKMGVPFMEVDVTTSTADAEYVRSLGYSSAPVVVVAGLPDGGTDHWAEYRPDNLNALAELVA